VYINGTEPALNLAAPILADRMWRIYVLTFSGFSMHTEMGEKTAASKFQAGCALDE
jgi:hypothetical protein